MLSSLPEKLGRTPGPPRISFYWDVKEQVVRVFKFETLPGGRMDDEWTKYDPRSSTHFSSTVRPENPCTLPSLPLCVL